MLNCVAGHLPGEVVAPGGVCLLDRTSADGTVRTSLGEGLLPIEHTDHPAFEARKGEARAAEQ